MKHIYKISGMSCNGCRNHVENMLLNVEGVNEAKVDLDKQMAEIKMEKHIPIEVFQNVLEKDGSKYGIHNYHDKIPTKTKDKQSEGQGSGIFYCPMHCEGEKTYNQPGDCPVCGMDLVEEMNSTSLDRAEWTCPMHPEVVTANPGSCPICGMELVPKEPSTTAEEKTYKKLLNKFWIALVFTIPVFIIAMSDMLGQNPLYDVMAQKNWNWFQLILSLPVIYATWMFFERAWRSIITWNLNMFTLIGIGSGVAWLFSIIGLIFPGYFPDQFKTDYGNVHVYFEAATVILTLVLLGQLLEARAHSKTNDAVKSLLKMAPNKAIKVVSGEEKEVSIHDIIKGDILRVKPGDKIPVDGVITNGFSSIDESLITGEPIPKDKAEGDHVSAGTINGTKSFLMRAEKVGSETLLAQIIEMVNKASRSQAPIQKIADKISAYFVPIVVLISVLTFIIWLILGPYPAAVYAFINAIAVLIIACPCALGLATPMSIMVGVGKGAQNGILVKNAEALEQLNQIDVLIIDKTGTITEGKPSVEKVLSVDKAYSEDEIVQFMASVNAMSEHPLAKATVMHGQEQDIPVLNVEEFNSITGKGVEGKVKGHWIRIGSDKLMNSFGVEMPRSIIDQAGQYQSEGKTVSYLAVDKKVAGVIVIGDKIKPTSQEAIQMLQEYGVEVLMLTGDNDLTARSVSRKLGIEYQAELLPEDKLKQVEKFQNQGKMVAMAGDGINDAPGLAKSNIGIAMGTGTDVAIESAKVTLVKGDLKGIVKAIKLSEAVMKNIKQNLFFALIYNIIGVPVAAGVLYPFFGILLSPMIAALAMSFSSVSVIGNALRLRSIDL